MLLVHLGAEEVLLSINGEVVKVSRREIEDTFANMLLELYEKHPFTRIYVIQGPGSFTAIRIGVLHINAFVMLKAPQIRIFTLSKIKFLHEVRKQYPNIVPMDYMLFIGQKKNVRKISIDMDFKEHLMSKKEALEEEGTFMTDCQDLVENGANMKEFAVTGAKLHHILVKIGDEVVQVPFTDLTWTQETQLQPKYLIKPNV